MDAAIQDFFLPPQGAMAAVQGDTALRALCKLNAPWEHSPLPIISPHARLASPACMLHPLAPPHAVPALKIPSTSTLAPFPWGTACPAPKAFLVVEALAFAVQLALTARLPPLLVLLVPLGTTAQFKPSLLRSASRALTMRASAVTLPRTASPALPADQVVAVASLFARLRRRATLWPVRGQLAPSPASLAPTSLCPLAQCARCALQGPFTI